jgi:CarD family transcriptional regulator
VGWLEEAQLDRVGAFGPDDAPEQSYSERQIFEAASSRLARELAAMEQTDEKSALAKILEVLTRPR